MSRTFLRIIAKALLPAFLLAADACILAAAPGTPKKMSSKAVYEQFRNPDVCYRPFVRWWWNGDAVEAEELVRELHLLKDAGIGGVEINPISMPSNADVHGHKTLRWLSDEWIDMLKVVFDEAERIGMTCDLIVGSGWPFGSETLPYKERASVLLTSATKVSGGSRYEVSEYEIFKNLDPGVTKVNKSRQPKLVSAYLAPDPMENLSQAIDVLDKFVDGVISVDVPQGSWMFYALVQYDSFASVINGAPGAAGPILDHMNAAAVKSYLDNMSNTIQGRIGPLAPHLRAFFVDSMELEGTNWTSDFREEFQRRRGYDCMPWLPFIMFKVGRLGDVESFDFGVKKSDAFKNETDRVRFDFELTKAELLHERYNETFLQWCRDNGVKSRSQTYGRGFFPLDTSFGYDIPEGESWTTNWLKHRLGEEMGDEDYRRGRGYTMIDKYVSSAAHLEGKRLVSAEEMTNTYLVFNTPLELLKVGSDMAAFSGITHSVWHGFNYSPKDVAFPGWVQYGSFYNENNTWWPYWHLLNDYRARMCAVLQNVDMYTDMAILPPNADLWSEMGVQTEPFPVKLNVTATSLIWEAIHKNGGGADYLSENVIENSTVRKGKLCFGPKEYGTVFLVEVKGTTQKTIDKLLEFVKDGGRVFCTGNFPSRSLGLKDWQDRDEQFAKTVEELKSYKDRFILLEKPAEDKYLEWYAQVSRDYNLPHSVTIATPDRFLLQNRYVGDDKADYFLFVNANMSQTKETDLVFPKSIVKGRKAWIYDMASGERYSIRLEGNKYHLKLNPSQSCFIVFNNLSGSAKAWNQAPAVGSDSLVVDNWHVSLHHSHLDWTKEMEMETLKDLKDTEFVNFMGDVTYTATVKVSGKAPKYLDLGKVCEIAELSINGRKVGVRWFGPCVFDVSGLLHEGENTIEVKVTTLMGNYMQSLKDNKAAQNFVIKRKQPLRSMGLLGPVVLY